MNETATEPPAGMLKAPQLGEVAPAAGFEIEVRVAPPASTTESVVARLSGDGSASESTAPVAVPYPAAFEAVMV